MQRSNYRIEFSTKRMFNKLTSLLNSIINITLPILLFSTQNVAIAERINEINLGGGLTLTDEDKRRLYDYLIKILGKRTLLLSDNDIIDNMI